MASPARNILVAGGIAALLAALLAAPSIAGVSLWKIVLAGLGLLLFFLSGRGTARNERR